MGGMRRSLAFGIGGLGTGSGELGSGWGGG